MAKSIARSTSSSCANPVLDLWTVVGGALIDVFALEYQIFDLSSGTPVQTFPPSGRATVAVGVDCPTNGAGHLQTGRYVANWTVDPAEPLGAHRILWFMTATSTSTEVPFSMDFDVLAAGLSAKGPQNVRLSEIRDEGFTTAMISDARGLTLIGVVTRMVERWTKRFFEPRYRTVTLDGSSGPTLFLQDPIVALDSARIDKELVDADTYQVFNRHLAEGLTSPDDRDNPRISFQKITRIIQRLDVDNRPVAARAIFWPGPRNVQLSGLFGFTDPSDDLPVGETPVMIKRVTMMLLARELPGIGNIDDRQEASQPAPNNLRTRDQSVIFNDDRSVLVKTGTVGEFTGDPGIDDIIAQYTAPPFIGGV